MQFLLDSLVGRQTEIDRLLGVFAGIIPLPTYFSTRNFVRLLGICRAARAVIRDPGLDLQATTLLTRRMSCLSAMVWRGFSA